jgi:hypothetical protein
MGRGNGKLKQKKIMLTLVVLQCTHLLEPVVVYDRGSGEAGRLQHNHCPNGTCYGQV